jgi:hypothetical protein
MSLITIDLDSLTAGDKLKVQTGMFGLVQSETITQPSEVDNASLKAYLDNLVDTRTCNEERKSHDGAFSYTAPVLG